MIDRKLFQNRWFIFLQSVLIFYLRAKNLESVIESVIKPFHATGLFLYHLKFSENQRFSDVFKGYRKIPVVRIRLPIN